MNHSYTFKTSKQEQKQNIKQQNTETKNKENAMLSPLWTHQNIKVRKCLALAWNNFSQSCEKRTPQVVLIVSALIQRCDCTN